MAKKTSRYDSFLQSGYSVPLNKGLRVNLDKPDMPRGFEHFTSPSVEIGSRMAKSRGEKVKTSATVKREHGCLEKQKKTKTGGKRMVFTGFRKDGRYDSFCKAEAGSVPCISAKSKDALRASCPVQMVIVRGEYALRFCEKAGAPGRIVRVGSTKGAQKLSAAACEHWKKHGKSFNGFNFPSDEGLGRARKRSRR